MIANHLFLWHFCSPYRYAKERPEDRPARLGLFGLVAFVAAKRTKEIGVRKVLGAPVTQHSGLLSTDFVRLVVISFLIAAPVGWYCMNNWLMQFTYRIPLPWTIFALAGLCALLIPLATISY